MGDGMRGHPFLEEYLRMAYGCMACDGEIADAEVACLRSIAVQLGQPIGAVDPALEAIGAEFSTDAVRAVERAMTSLRRAQLTHNDASLLVDMLVQMAEADGTIRASERSFIRKTVQELRLDRDALRSEHPEWRSYLTPEYSSAGVEMGRPEAIFEELPDRSVTIALKRP